MQGINVKSRRELKRPRPALIMALSVYALVAGCSDAQDYDVARLTDKQRVRVHQTLTADQLKKLDDWTNRVAASGKGVPTGVTVQRALKDQDEWLARRKSEEAKADELIRKGQAEYEAKQQKFVEILAVTLMSKTNVVQVDDRKFVALEIAYLNKTEHDIRGVKGTLKLTDIYGYGVIDIAWYYEGGILARQTAVERGVGIYIVKSVDSQVRLWNTDFEKLILKFAIDTIFFKDGTRMNNSDQVRVIAH